MDRLDKFSIALIVILVAVLVVMSRDFPEGSVNKAGDRARRATGVMLLGKDALEIRSMRRLIDSNNIEKAEQLLGVLLEKYPYEGEPFMLKGDILIRKQEPVNAIFAYREAVDLNPDYIDKKTPLYQGRKIEVALKEARVEIEASHSGGVSRDLKKAKKTMYYLLRRLAGSCG
jgi:tetratricopeptide (TPR) repeat protein